MRIETLELSENIFDIIRFMRKLRTVTNR